MSRLLTRRWQDKSRTEKHSAADSGSECLAMRAARRRVRARPVAWSDPVESQREFTGALAGEHRRRKDRMRVLCEHTSMGNPNARVGSAAHIVVAERTERRQIAEETRGAIRCARSSSVWALLERSEALRGFGPR